MILASKLLVVAVLIATASGCAPESQSIVQARKEVESRQARRSIYVEKNDTEFNNYNRRQVVADDPTTILWCTSAFPIPSSPLFTVPVVGKLTSGGKRPYPTQKIESVPYYPELPGPDGMYGQSGEYRYGFTPAGVYIDFYNISTFCTTEPTVWQRESTTIVLAIDPTLAAAQKQARELLKQGKTAEAQAILEQAIKGVKR
jgi:hypothetical protein